MPVIFNPTLKANIFLDDTDRVRHITHSQEYFISDSSSALLASIEYINKISGILRIPKQQISNLQQRVSYMEPADRGIEYHLSEEKQFFDSTTFGFYQTYLNVPVWQAGLSVTVKHAPYRIIGASNTSQEGFDAKLPPKDSIERYKKMFALASKGTHMRKMGFFAEDKEEDETADFIRSLIKRSELQEPPMDSRGKRKDDARMIRGRFHVYKYDEKNRLPPQRIEPPNVRSKREQKEKESVSPMFHEEQPILPLPPVNKKIEDGKYYLVAEITFSYTTEEFGHLNWRALVEVETDSVLLLHSLAAFVVKGMVFKHDPITSGNPTYLPNSTNEVLNRVSTPEDLSNLAPPVMEKQSLEGSRIVITNIDTPNIDPPTNPPNIDFNYNARTNNFGAVNCYYHSERFFALVESLGFRISDYFKDTSFPLGCDHRGLGSLGWENKVNAHCLGNGSGGIGHCCYALADTTDIANPIGIACDWRIVLHELGGHGVLNEHVDYYSFAPVNNQFCHSAGDSIAVIMSDPESQAQDRFTCFPWMTAFQRRFDRKVADGWAWRGVNDRGDYSTEQILTTTLFRVYQSIGGDSEDIERKRFAARMMTYLILRYIGTLTPATNPDKVEPLAEGLINTDLMDWTTEGVYGGAYNKVIRWSFEKQGLYQAPGSEPPVTTPGQPPEEDVYIDDGRGGEYYPFKPVHWDTTTIWNRRMRDGGTSHEEPALGATNYAYVKIKNRGTYNAYDVKVRGYHTRPGAGLIWPTDFEPLSTPEINIGRLGPNNTEERTVGPFEWTPTINAYGHDCLLMIASSQLDPSNINYFTIGEVIPEWRLVPNDNNISLRNVFPVAAAGGIRGLMEGLDNVSFWVGNPNLKTSIMELQIKLPKLLASKRWRISFKDLSDTKVKHGSGRRRRRRTKFRLESGKKKEILLKLHPGKEFKKEEVEKSKDRDIQILLYADNMLIGGMTYRLDPNIKKPYNKRKPIPR
jgi:hypothetical protein